MRRIISRSRTVRPPRWERSELDPSSRRPPPGRGSRPPIGRGAAPRSKGSLFGVLAVILIMVGIVGWAIWSSQKSAEKARKAGPDAVVKEVIAALGQGKEGRAGKFVKEGDTTTSTQLSTLFNNYQQYTSVGEDYISWSNMGYEVKSITDTEAQVTVSGTAEIIEGDITTWTDEEGYEHEEKTKASRGKYSFSGVIFELKKVGEEWFLGEIPSKIF